MLRRQFSSCEAPFLRKRFVGGKKGMSPQHGELYSACLSSCVTKLGLTSIFNLDSCLLLSQNFSVAIRFAFTSLQAYCPCNMRPMCAYEWLSSLHSKKLCAGLYSLWKTGNNSLTNNSTKSREKLMMTSSGQEPHSRSSTRRKTSLC